MMAGVMLVIMGPRGGFGRLMQFVPHPVDDRLHPWASPS